MNRFLLVFIEFNRRKLKTAFSPVDIIVSDKLQFRAFVSRNTVFVVPSTKNKKIVTGSTETARLRSISVTRGQTTLKASNDPCVEFFHSTEYKILLKIISNSTGVLLSNT